MSKPNTNEIVIPELDEIMKTYRHTTPWSEKDIAVLKKYFRRVPDTDLGKALNRSPRSVVQKAASLCIKEGTG